MKGTETVSSNDVVVISGYLEMIAKLIEATAKTPAEAAQIVRDAKVFRD